MTKDLEGLLVVSIEQAVAAPYLTGRLAEAGARVIKIEREEGDFARAYDHLVHGESAYFVWLNRGKESICLDLRAEADRAVLEVMIAKADVFVQNLAPGAIDRLGYAPETLRAANPRLITVSISGYGDEGPYAKLKAYDLLVQAESGLSAITGNEAGSARVGVSVCDIACGMTAHQAVLQALIGRGITGKGRHIAVSLFHALTDWMNVPYLQYAYGGKEPARNGLSHPTIAPYGAFAGSDDKLVLLSIQNEREWVKFCEGVLERPEIATDPKFSSNSARVANRAELDALICEIFAEQPRDALSDKLHAAGIANGRVSTMEDLARHPQNRYVEVETPTGPVRLLSPGALADGQVPEFGPVPALGEHTAALRAEFGESA
ncbi:CaiB/BaiF CoA transferase family protein [Vannielia litorea]|uniref:CaiB/BaiF CoA transferase family protein n=1 Tax=Vannielia litorea TaxID=1217970 RepID=UPI001C97211F|nr:CaiB/BaiF CoA-transferase family protein [Vannielia litorea]MBY6048432.1 CoA transferase [Vannielia litorea]MBY6075846.1 CoA transferase [Vannielia litorea]